MAWTGKVLMALVAALLLFWLYAWHGSIDPVAPPAAAAFSPADVAQGRILAGAGNCASCHQSNNSPLAGGRPMATPFGTIHASNITPDTEHGIGRWSLAAFDRAMRDGVAPDGSHYYPAFPYTHFTRISDQDVAALYAYLMTRDPVATAEPANDLGFPFNFRMLVAGWKLLYFDQGRHQDHPDQSPAWNRGSYLANGLGHCSACHSPRSVLGAEADPWAGALVNGWYAPALDERNTSAMPWSQDEMHSYLRTGASRHHGVAMGDMATVVHEGLGMLPDQDIQALALWFADLAGAGSHSPETGVKTPLPMARSGQDESTGAALYLNACAGCHYNGSGDDQVLRPNLAGNSALTGPEPVNLLRALLDGVSAHEGLPGTMMPGYSGAMSDQELADLARWLRTSHAGSKDLPGRWADLPGELAQLRQQN